MDEEEKEFILTLSEKEIEKLSVEELRLYISILHEEIEKYRAEYKEQMVRIETLLTALHVLGVKFRKEPDGIN